MLYDYNVLVTRACLPPHVIKFFKLENVQNDEPISAYKEITVEAEPFWDTVYFKYLSLT